MKFEYEVVKRIIYDKNDYEQLIIEPGTRVYKLPSDHMVNEKGYDFFNWDGEIFKLEKGSDCVREV